MAKRPKYNRPYEGTWITPDRTKYVITITYLGKRHNYTAYTQAKESSRLREDVLRDIERHKAGTPIVTDGMPEEQRYILTKLGILRPTVVKPTDPATLVTLRCKIVRGSAHHRKRNEVRLTEFAKTITSITDINADDTLLYIDNLTTGKTTKNHTLRTIKSWTRWMYRSGYLPNDPLAVMVIHGNTTDIRIKRRACTDEEFAKLLAATTGENKLPADARRLVYQTARFSGLRAEEISLITADRLEGRSICLGGEDTKNDKAVRQPIPAWLAKELAEYAHGRSGKIFPGCWYLRGAEMLRTDLAAAGIPFLDSRGRRLDFHALRHSYVTGLARKGVKPKELQKLARHSTITLTLGVYAHLDDEELAAVVEEALG